MPRQKKSRKIGQIGTPKDPNHRKKDNAKNKRSQTSVTRVKKGNPSGSRHNVEGNKKQSTAAKSNTDPRHGSKTPIVLVTNAEIKRYATPAEELAAIEADSRLTALLDKIDQEQTLRKEQQAYVNAKLARHAELCKMLGINVDEDDSVEESDPLDTLDAISMRDFVDSDSK